MAAPAVASHASVWGEERIPTGVHVDTGEHLAQRAVRGVVARDVVHKCRREHAIRRPWSRPVQSI